MHQKRPLACNIKGRYVLVLFINFVVRLADRMDRLSCCRRAYPSFAGHRYYFFGCPLRSWTAGGVRRRAWWARLPGGVMSQILGVVLVVLGLVGLVWGGITYTTQEKVVDIGPIHESHEKSRTSQHSPSPICSTLLEGQIQL